MIANERFASPEPFGARRQQILSAAAALFAERGYHGASMNDIGKRVGLLKGSLYAHIANKEEMLLEVVGTTMRRLFASVTPALSGSAPAGTRIRLGLRAHVQVVADDPEAALVLTRESGHLAGQPGIWLADTRRRYDLMWFRVFREGVETGEFRQNLDLDAVSFLALSAGGAWSQRVGLGGEPLAFADHCCDILLGGCLAMHE